MNKEAFADEAVLGGVSRSISVGVRIRNTIKRYWYWAAAAAVAILLWLPRLSGPIDLRWDAGVYYLLGTSLAQGHGYRIPSEPGSPQALQYPPLLSAIVGGYQRVLGTADPAVVGPWLRKSYAGLFLAYALAVLALARRQLRPEFAIAATGLCLLQVMTIFLSDLLFAELPFAFVSVIFAIVASNNRPAPRPWLREAAAFALAAISFLLRTAGVALLGAWVLEAVIRCRWRLAIGRAVMALLPVLGWQIYIASVMRSDEYRHPAYEYQRAPYQYYNVSYTENVRLLDPFRPELGRMTVGAFAARLATNLPSVLASLGEGVSTKRTEWYRMLEYGQRRVFGKVMIPGTVAIGPIFGLTILVLIGIIILLRRGAWLMAFVVLASVALTWTTPWPAQFNRYLMPLAPFLSICAVLALSQLADALGKDRGNWLRIASRAGFGGIVSLMFAAALYTSIRLFQLWTLPEAIVLPRGNTNYRWFAHDASWQTWEEVTTWIDTHTPREAIVATSAPHFLYLRTGRRAVLPPMDPDPAAARRLLESVPVSYVIVDELEFVDISRRYARPAVESDPAHWQVVHSIGDTKTYARIASAE
jgi:hypothetical protein